VKSEKRDALCHHARAASTKLLPVPTTSDDASLPGQGCMKMQIGLAHSILILALMQGLGLAGNDLCGCQLYLSQSPLPRVYGRPSPKVELLDIIRRDVALLTTPSRYMNDDIPASQARAGGIRACTCYFSDYKWGSKSGGPPKRPAGFSALRR
jgi:hypothetical protein